ncbi:MAG: grasp-with-spasm system SPASM domain peptide maturase [Hyphomicrobiales bacterium]
MKKQYYRLYANCIPVKGYKESIIVDLQRQNSTNKIPNSLFEILDKYPDESIEDIKAIYNNEYDETIDEYFNFLLRKEFIFLCEKKELECFPKLDLTWKSPSGIENAIIDICEYRKEDLNKAIEDLSELQCNALEIRFEKIIGTDILKQIGLLLKGSRILSVEILLKYTDDITFENLLEIADQYPRYQRISVYNSPNNQISACNRILFNTKDINPVKDCGKISSMYFCDNINMFTESQCYNSCLNRKISIDSSGNIKNCPSMPHSYGHISNTSLKEVINNKEFLKYWTISKDQIEVCKDCEYRYICSDCRAYTKNQGLFSQPEKCTYNPYIAKWKGDEGFISVEDCINKKPS